MKITRCTSLFLALLILVSNFGMAINVHYCGGKIAGISTVYNYSESATAIRKCCADKAKENKSCCKDKIVTLNKKADFTSKAYSFHADPVVPLLKSTKIFHPAIPLMKSILISSYYCDANAPPLFKLYSQYIFYA